MPVVRQPQSRITPESVARYLKRHGFFDAHIESMTPLGQEVQQGLKAYGYGSPLRVHFTAQGRPFDIVFRTMHPDPFGHDRRADRIAAHVLAFDTFGHVPRHLRAEDVGVFDASGELVSLACGEGFLTTEFVEGELYAEDLARIAHAKDASALDQDRAITLARYLAELHTPVQDEPSVYHRALRDTVGSGEGILGLCDAYPDHHPVASADRLQAIELAAVRWRWQLRSMHHRLRRTHGDFHPFNILFRERTDFTVLDASRGGRGDPADDVTAMSINYLFFALAKRGTFEGALRQLWNSFWFTYLEASGDAEVLHVVAPFFAWRALVVASPVWYPDIDDHLRDTLLCFAERLLGGRHFHPFEIDALLA